MRLRDTQTLREGDYARELIASPGWESLARWINEQAQMERDALERGVGSWDEYQRSVGRLGAFQEVLDRPGIVVDEADREARGDSE